MFVCDLKHCSFIRVDHVSKVKIFTPNEMLVVPVLIGAAGAVFSLTKTLLRFSCLYLFYVTGKWFQFILVVLSTCSFVVFFMQPLSGPTLYIVVLSTCSLIVYMFIQPLTGLTS